MSFSITGVSFLLFSLLIVATLGYLFGHIKVRGVSLGTAGVLIIAVLYGIFFFDQLDSATGGYAKDGLKIVENLGLILFVSSVGFLAGPTFFRSLKINLKKYAPLCLIIVLTGALTAALFLLTSPEYSKQPTETTAIVAGLYSGAVTSTPAFSAAKSTVESFGEDLVNLVTVGNAIAYLGGVVGKVLFIQLIPTVLHADMKQERELFLSTLPTRKNAENDKKLKHIDPLGITSFVLTGALGILLGQIMIGKFSLTTTGGCLFVSILLGHIGRIGKFALVPTEQTLKVFRELGLLLFLIGAGIPGGAAFLQYFKPIYFLYGLAMTLLPLTVGFLFAKYVLKLPLLANLGAISGGMTSTPALGALIHVSKLEEVATAYATIYPMALITIVFAAQILVICFA